MPPKKPQPSRPPAAADCDVDMAAHLGRSTMESLQKVFERLDRNNDGKIDKDELMQQFDDLGYRPRKITDYGNSEVEDIIWEVDEDCDGLVDWDNFVLMYVAPFPQCIFVTSCAGTTAAASTKAGASPSGCSHWRSS